MNLSENIVKIGKIYPVYVAESRTDYTIGICGDFDSFAGITGLNEQAIMEDIFDRLSELKPKKMGRSIVIRK